MDLCNSLDCLAIRTWNYLDLGLKTNIYPNEETFTDINLIDLQSTHPRLTICHKNSKRKEGTSTGADWEWWIGNRGRWLVLRVQAKKRKKGSLTYGQLDYSSHHGRQVDLLIMDALRHKYAPIYCFYNFWDTNTRTSQWNCCRSKKNEELLGCAIAAAHKIKRLISNTKAGLKDILAVSYPWSCLICCKRFLGAGKDIVERTKEFLTESLGIEEDSFDIIETPPEYVNKLIRAETELHEVPDLSYVVITTETSIH